jgi:AcrR family transcriptional regulator
MLVVPAAIDDTQTVSTRDRLLLAGAELLDAAQGGEVSTRAICEAAGVQAPTLYHHFGSKQNLLDAVITHGFKAFLAEHLAASPDDDDNNDGGDPLDAIRRGWDLHVRYGIENPNFYVRIYGNAVPGRPCGVVAEVEAMILAALQPAARRRRLRVAPERAARQILAASTGVVLTLISQPADGVDLSLSDDVRDAVLASISTPGGRHGRGRAAAPPPSSGPASAAIALRAALENDPGPLSPTEAALLDDWLVRLSAASPR